MANMPMLSRLQIIGSEWAVQLQLCTKNEFGYYIPVEIYRKDLHPALRYLAKAMVDDVLHKSPLARVAKRIFS